MNQLWGNEVHRIKDTARMADHHHDAAEHKHGTMDTSVQERTFAGFIRMASWGAGISIGILIFMALVNA